MLYLLEILYEFLIDNSLGFLVSFFFSYLFFFSICIPIFLAAILLPLIPDMIDCQLDNRETIYDSAEAE